MATATQGTITPASPFDPEADCKKLRSAMKGLGTDEKALIDVICYRSNAQRQELKLKFKSMYGRDLVDDIKSEISGDFEKTVLDLMMLPAEFEATEVKRAIKGLGTDEAVLVELLCTKTNEEMTALKAAYKKLFKKDLEKDVSSDTSGDFKRLLVSCITAHREPEGAVDQAKAAKDAQDLYKAGEGKLGTDETAFNMVMAARSFSHLRAVFDEYGRISKNNIETAIKKEMSGDLEAGMLAIVKSVRDRPAYFAEKLYKSMKGAGTDEHTLTRIMVTRSEIDMVQIKQRFQEHYGKTLASFIKGDTSGDYERVLLGICRQ